MLYFILKIMHILGAALLLAGIFYTCILWKNKQTIQGIALYLIFPAVVFQLLSGFTIISVQSYATNQLWVQGSVMSFIALIACWVGGLSLSFSRVLQKSLFVLSGLVLLCMIFLMANKIP